MTEPHGEDTSGPTTDPSPESPEERFASRVAFYRRLAQAAREQAPQTFEAFVAPFRNLSEIGDKQLSRYGGTAYNLLPSAEVMALQHGAEALELFYSNYVGRPEHFGLVLAEMEQQGLITPDQVRLNVYASKTFRGKWAIDPAHEVVETLERRRAGQTNLAEFTKTVEMVVTVRPRDAELARQIGRFLIERCSQLRGQAIAGSWDVPDIRASAACWPALAETNACTLVQANLLERPDGAGTLVIGRRTRRFRPPWQPVSLVMNTDLAEFLSTQESGVRP